MTLPEAIKKMAGSGKVFPVLCEVVEVDSESGTVDLLPLYEPEFFGVRVNAEISPAKGLKILPKVGSKVFMLPINSETGIVVLTSEVDSWSLKIGTAILEQNETGLLVKKGDDTLKQALQLIIESVMKIVVIQGTNPDYPKLQEALTKVQNLLR